MSRTVFKRAMVAGINHAMEKKAYIAWPSPEVAEREVCKLADSLEGPDMLPEGGLKQASAVAIANELVKTAKAYQAAGHKPSAAYAAGVKTASSRDLYEVAGEAAVAHMRKLAGESMIMAGGEHSNTLADAAKTDDLAKLDLHNRPEGAYMVPQGHTQMPQGGVVGEEMAHPKAPATSPALDNTVAKKVASASDKELVQLGFNALPAAQKTATMAHLKSGKAVAQEKIASALKAAGRRVLSDRLRKEASAKKAEMDPQALLEMLSHPQGHPEVEGQISPEVAALIMQLMGGGAAGGAGAAAPGMGGGMDAGMGGGMPEGLGGGMPEGMHPEPDGDEGPVASQPPKDKPEEEKDASVRQVLAFLNKVAEGGSLTDSDPNTLASAAKTDSVAKLDEHNRPEGEYEVAQGKTEMPNAGHVGAKKETPPSNSDHADTAPVREQAKSAAEAEYIARATKVAEQWLPKLPATMPKVEKIAFIKKMTGPSPAEQEALAKGYSGT